MSRWRRHAETVRSIEGLKAFADRLSQAIGAVDRAAEWLLDTGRSEDERLGAAAPFMSLLGTVTAAAYIPHGIGGGASGSGALPGRHLRLATFFCDDILLGANGFSKT